MHKIKLTMILILALSVAPLWAGEGNEVEALRQRVRELEIERLKLRLNLADEKIISQRFEFNLLVTERGRICNEIQATDRATFESRCTDKGSK